VAADRWRCGWLGARNQLERLTAPRAACSPRIAVVSNRQPLVCKSEPDGHRVSLGPMASWNAQFSGWFVSTVSAECRAVFARLGTLLAQRGFRR
jgi:hypothetical protein